MDTRFIISRGSDDQQAPRVSSFTEAEAVAKDESQNSITGQAVVTTWDGVWLVTYKAGKLVKCNLDAVAEVL